MASQFSSQVLTQDKLKHVLTKDVCKMATAALFRVAINRRMAKQNAKYLFSEIADTQY